MFIGAALMRAFIRVFPDRVIQSKCCFLHPVPLGQQNHYVLKVVRVVLKTAQVVHRLFGIAHVLVDGANTQQFRIPDNKRFANMVRVPTRGHSAIYQVFAVGYESLHPGIDLILPGELRLALCGAYYCEIQWRRTDWICKEIIRPA